MLPGVQLFSKINMCISQHLISSFDIQMYSYKSSFTYIQTVILKMKYLDFTELNNNPSSLQAPSQYHIFGTLFAVITQSLHVG